MASHPGTGDSGFFEFAPVTSQDAAIIFEDDAIRVIWRPGPADHVMVTFAGLLKLANGRRFFADTPLRKLGIGAVGVVAKRGHWYPRAHMQAALPAIMARIAGHREVLAYGTSMGGHAALKHARLLGATHVIACGPQWSVDPAECEVAPSWRRHFTPDMAGMGIRADDIAGRVFVLRDPWHADDERNARRIAALDPGISLIPVYGAGHGVVEVLAGTASLAGMIGACLAGDARAMAQRCRAAGRHNPSRIRKILRRAMIRHAELAIPAILRLDRQEVARRFRPHLAAILTWLLRHDRAEEAIALYHATQELGVPSAARGELAAAMAALKPLSPMLAVGPGRMLVYDATTDAIAHRRGPLRLGEIALRPELRKGQLRLFCEADDLRLPVRLDRGGRLVIAGDGAKPSRFTIEGDALHQFALRSGQEWLAADASGNIRLAAALPDNPAPFSLSFLPPPRGLGDG